MKILKKSGGIPLINYLVLAAAVVGATSAAINTFESNLKNDLDTLGENYVTGSNDAANEIGDLDTTPISSSSSLCQYEFVSGSTTGETATINQVGSGCDETALADSLETVQASGNISFAESDCSQNLSQNYIKYNSTATQQLIQSPNNYEISVKTIYTSDATTVSINAQKIGPNQARYGLSYNYATFQFPNGSVGNYDACFYWD